MSRDEMIEKMLDAYAEAKDQDFSGTRGDCRACMAAALDVAVGELLPKPEDDPELENDLQAVVASWNWSAPMDLSKVRVQTFIRDACCIYRSRLAYRRFRYQKPKSDPAVEAVLKFIGHWSEPRKNAEQIVAAVRKADAK